MRITDIIKETRGKDREAKEISFAEIKKVDREEEEKRREEAHKLYERAVEELRGISRAVIEGRAFNIDNLQEISRRFIESLLSHDYLLLETISRDEKEWDLPVHSVNTVIIAFRLGIGLKYDSKTLDELLLCTFLHDLGMLGVPEGLKNKRERLTDEEYEVIKRHPKEGYRILKGLGERYSMMAKVAYQEHEKEDGSGYPSGLKGDEIHEFAKIIGMADIYGALIHSRPHRSRYHPFEAVKEIIKAFRGCFSTKIMKAMLNELSIFPIGVYVRLNTNEIGRVVATNPFTPLRPTVEILFNQKGRPLKEPRYINLSKEHLINISETFFKEEVEETGRK